MSSPSYHATPYDISAHGFYFSTLEEYQEKAEIIADDIEPEPLRRLLYYLVDTVLSRSESSYMPTIDFVEPTMKDALPIVAS